MLNLLVGPIRQTLRISDFQISLLQGLAFAIFYTACGLPLGWLVDHRPRRRIVFLGTIVWSLSAAGCGLAGRYWHLLLGRIGVAAGEATLAPAAYSMLGDLFPPRKLALPMSVMGTGAGLGGALAAVLGGLIVDAVPGGGVEVPLLGLLHSWQVALLVTGLPGLLLAPIVFSFPEPARHVAPVAAPARSGPLGALRYALDHPRRYGGHSFGFGVFAMCNYGLTTWLPTFFIRKFELSMSAAALTTGGLVLLAGLPGGIVMGWCVDRWFGSGRRDAHMIFYGWAAIVEAVLAIAAFQVNSPVLSVLLIALPLVFAGFTGVGGAALQIFTPREMRGQMSALYVLVFNLIGLGLGPSMVAMFTDFFFADDLRVGDSISLVFLIFAPVSATLFFLAARPMREAVSSV